MGIQLQFDPLEELYFFDVIHVLLGKQPKAIFLENVKNLKGHDNGNTFKVIEEMLEEKVGTISQVK